MARLSTIKTFRTLAAKSADLAKGDAVIVVGSIVTDNWTDTETGGTRGASVQPCDADRIHARVMGKHATGPMSSVS